MCGVIGFFCSRFDANNERVLKAVIDESKARGLHAFGISFIVEGVLSSKTWPHFVTNELEPYWKRFRNEPLMFIAHCRYSTSELADNQPIFNSKLAIVHNGVISQKLPETWEKEFGYKCRGRNDTELLFQSRVAGKHPFSTWPKASIAAVELSVSRGMCFYRNGKRPLFYAQGSDHLVVFSTQDIGQRAGLDPVKTMVGVIYTVDDFTNLTPYVASVTEMEDYQ